MNWRRFSRAEETARALLMQHLNAKQRYDLSHHHAFTVEGSDGNIYVIHDSSKRNVERIGLAHHGHGYWTEFHYRHDGLPPSDRLLAQKLLVETDVAKLINMSC